MAPGEGLLLLSSVAENNLCWSLNFLSPFHFRLGFQVLVSSFVLIQKLGKKSMFIRKIAYENQANAVTAIIRCSNISH